MRIQKRKENKTNKQRIMKFARAERRRTIILAKIRGERRQMSGNVVPLLVESSVKRRGVWCRVFSFFLPLRIRLCHCLQC